MGSQKKFLNFLGFSKETSSKDEVFQSFKNKINYQKILGYSSIPINLLAIIIIALSYNKMLPSYWNSLYIFYIAILINTIFLAIIIRNLPENQREKSKINFYSKYFFLLGLIIIAVNQFMKFTIVNTYINYIIGVVVALGFITFYSSRERVEKEMEDETQDEERAEVKRKEEFARKFPGIAKIWGVRSIVKWMYKEGWWYSITLIIIVIYGALLIFPNLGLYDIYGDEMWHISTMESLKNGQGFHLWNYISQKPMTMYVIDGRIADYGGYITTSIFGYNNFNLRFVTALFGLLNIILIYLVFKKIIGKAPALLTSFGFTVNINALYLARFLRPYTVSLFFYLLAFYFSYKLIEELSKKLIDIKKLIIYLLFLIICTTISIEERELGKILLIIFPIYFLVSILFNKNLRYKIFKENYKLLILSGGILILILFLIDFFKIINLTILYNQTEQFLSLDKIYNPTKIYYNYLFEKWIKIPALFYSMFLFGIIFLIYNYITKKRNKYLLILIFELIPLFIMIYLLKMGEDPRYVYFLIPFTLAVSLYCLSYLIRPYFKFKSLNYKNEILLILAMVISILLIFYIILPINDIKNFSLKPPSGWVGKDAAKYWHPRGVPPEFTKAYNYLNSIQKERDIVIMMDGEWNIIPKENIDYYSIAGFTYTKNVSNIRDYDRLGWGDRIKNETNFLNLINNSKGKNIYFIGQYFLMLDKSIPEYLLNNCKDLSPDINILQYEMWSYEYSGKFRWPSLFVCNP